MKEGERVVEPCALVIFGASGDLTRRKLLPALYALAQEKRLPPALRIVGVGRRETDFVEDMRSAVEQFGRLQPLVTTAWDVFAKRLSYVRGELDDPALYERLGEHLTQLDRLHGTGQNRLFYLATPPELFATLLTHLSEKKLISHQTKPFGRVVVEKPFGHDLESAEALNALCARILREDQMFRIDHYLGKETVQNILAFRFANSLFEPLWNQKYIDHVQITVAESLGVEGRGGYYEHSGALRDMIQNHLFQLLALVAMEPPVSFTAEAVRNEKVKVLQSLREPPMDASPSWLVRGQYSSGKVHGQSVCGYRQEPDVPPDSSTETYVALRLWVDNWRFGGVPFYIRSGKRLPHRVSEVAITFRSVPHALFPRGPSDSRSDLNVLVLRIQPDEGIALTVLSKTPGSQLHVQPIALEFRFGNRVQGGTPDAYERLLLDALTGDGTLFIRRDEVLASWRFCDRILQAWKEHPTRYPVSLYPAGTWGPVEAQQLLLRDGRAWREP